MDYLELVMAFIMVGGLAAIMVERLRSKRGIGVRVIQLAAVVMLLPIILILALRGILDSATVGTLLGAVAGYILSGIGKDDPAS